MILFNIQFYFIYVFLLKDNYITKISPIGLHNINYSNASLKCKLSVPNDASPFTAVAYKSSDKRWGTFKSSFFQRSFSGIFFPAVRIVINLTKCTKPECTMNT